MSGHGETEREALTDLEAKFKARKARGEAIPRPGTGLPIEFAMSIRVQRHERLARDFFQKVLGLNYGECFISNESSLWDFHDGEDNTELCAKIRTMYGVDVSDIEGGKLADIFDRLVSRGVSS